MIRWIFFAVGSLIVAALVCLTGRSHITLVLDDPTEDDEPISPAVTKVLEELAVATNRKAQDELLDTYNALTRERAV